VSATLVAKGSITVDGVSLTVNKVEADRFWVTLIPHTLAVTTLGAKMEGARVNLEGDLLAKHVDRLVRARLEATAASPRTNADTDANATDGRAREGLSLETLRKHGFV
jgi:riboflavin synthase